MRHLFILVVCFVGVSLALDSRWKLLWSDEFSGTELDQTKWTARDQAGLTNNGEQEWYSPSMVYLQDGHLVLKSQPDSSHTDFGYISGMVDTQGKFFTTSGRYEINARLPNGKGIWPAHWLLSQYRCWPVGAEIDIMEDISAPVSTIVGTYHWGTTCGGDHGNGTAYETGIDLSQSYHTYAVEWDSEDIKWYFDDVMYKKVNTRTVNNGDAFSFDMSPHYIILNTAVGGYWPGYPDSTNIWPQYHYIDYVRVYAWEPCVSGCGDHGCCNYLTATCMCDSGYEGTTCEFSNGVNLVRDFQLQTSEDRLSGTASISNGLTLTAQNRQGSMWSWDTPDKLAQGTFTFTVKSTGVSGQDVYLYGGNGDQGWQAFQIALPGGNTNQLTFQTWGGNFGWSSYNLGFDSSAAFHTYTVKFTSVFEVLVDGVSILTTPTAPSTRFAVWVELQANADQLASAQVRSVSWSLANQQLAVCPTAPTPAPTNPPASNDIVCGQVWEGSSVTVSCPAGQQISNVQFASYGTPTGQCRSFQSGSCHASTSQSVVESACLNRQSCSIEAKNDVFQDPCGGTYKQLAVQVQCVASRTAICGASDREDVDVVLTCPVSSQKIVSVDFASYGNPTGSCGDSSFQSGWCNAGTSRSVVENACLNKNSCTVGATNNVFTDPCVGTGKRLALRATCL